MIATITILNGQQNSEPAPVARARLGDKIQSLITTHRKGA